MSRQKEIAELREKAQTAFKAATDAKALVGKDDAPADIQETFEKGMDDFEKYMGEADEMKAIDDQETSREDRYKKAAERLNRPSVAQTTRKQFSDLQVKEKEDLYEKAYFQYALHGSMISDEYREALSYGRENFATVVTDGADTAGGYYVPTSVQEATDLSIAMTGPMANPEVVNFISDNEGFTRRVVTFDASAITAAATNQDSAATEVSATFGNVDLSPNDYATGAIPVAIGAIQDAVGGSIQAFVDQYVGIAMGRGINTDATTGNGTRKISGVLNSFVAGQVKTVTTRDTLTWPDLVAVIDEELDGAYHDNPKTYIMMHRQFAGAVAELRASNVPFWGGFGRADDLPATLRQIPVRFNNALHPSLDGNTDIPFLVGDFSKYTLRRVGPMLTRMSAHAEWKQRNILFEGMSRYDGARTDGKAFAVLRNKA